MTTALLPFGHKGTSRPPPLACRAETTPHSAHKASPYRRSTGDHSAVIGQGRGAHREAEYGA